MGTPAKAFVEEACTRCGLCFSECPVMGNHLLKASLLPSYRQSLRPSPVSLELAPLPELPWGDRLRVKALAAFLRGPLVQNRLVRSLLSQGFTTAFSRGQTPSIASGKTRGI